MKDNPFKKKRLTVARKQLSTCRHRSILVDEKENLVECGECGAKLNPIAILLRFATEESNWEYQRNELRKVAAKLEKRKQTRCEQCGKITKISNS